MHVYTKGALHESSFCRDKTQRYIKEDVDFIYTVTAVKKTLALIMLIIAIN
jgi:hypothetical protein